MTEGTAAPTLEERVATLEEEISALKSQAAALGGEAVADVEGAAADAHVNGLIALLRDAAKLRDLVNGGLELKLRDAVRAGIDEFRAHIGTVGFTEAVQGTPATGGIVSGDTVANIGEQGPESVIPTEVAPVPVETAADAPGPLASGESSSPSTAPTDGSPADTASAPTDTETA